MKFSISAPSESGALFIRTDFTDDAAWERICELVCIPSVPDGYLADLEFVNDPRLKNLTPKDLVKLIPEPPPFFAFLADSVAISHPESPILVVDLEIKPGISMRVIPNQIWSIENNLSIGNMEFYEFSEAAKMAPDQIFRGF